MAGAITRGTSFSLGQQDITAAQFMALLTSATVANIDRDNVNLSAVTPSSQSNDPLANPQANEVWQQSTSRKCMTYVLGAWEPGFSSILNYTLQSGATTISPGDILAPTQSVFANDAEMEPCRTTGQFRAIGVSIMTTLPGHGGKMVVRGPALVKAAGAISPGQAIMQSSTVQASCEAVGALGSGFGPAAFGVALNTATGGYVWANIRR